MKATIKDLVVKSARDLYAKRLCSRIGDTIAIREGEDIYVTRDGTDFSSLTAKDVAKISDIKTSSNIFANILSKSTDINAIFHIHTHYISAIARANIEVPPVLDDTAQILGPNVRLVKNKNPKDISKALKNRGACILSSDGAIVAGRSLEEAHTASLVLEKACLIFVNGSVLGGVKPINKIESLLMHFVYKKKYSKIDDKKEKMELDVEISNDPRERELRQIVKDSGLELLENNLVQGTWGNTSIRLDKDRLISTPSGIAYEDLKPEQCAIVNIDNPKEWVGRLKPTSERRIHAGIMASKPDVNAVIHSHPTYCGVFAACNVNLPAFKEEINKILGGEIIVSKYGLPGTKKLTKNTVLGIQGRSATFMCNHGVVCCGEDMDDAFKKLKFLEECCREYIKIKTKELTGKAEYSDESLINYFVKTHKNK